MTDPVARTRNQLKADLCRIEMELERAFLRQDEDEIADLQRERRYARSQLASLDACFS